MLHRHQHCRGGLRQVPPDRGPQAAGGYRGQRSTILADAWRVASAVTPAPPGQATAARPVIACHRTPDQGCGDTQSWGMYMLWRLMRAPPQNGPGSEDRSAAGRHETGHSLRWNALEPGFHGVPAGSRARDTGHGNGLRAHEYQGCGRNLRRYPRTVPALQGGDPRAAGRPRWSSSATR